MLRGYSCAPALFEDTNAPGSIVNHCAGQRQKRCMLGFRSSVVHVLTQRGSLSRRATCVLDR